MDELNYISIHEIFMKFIYTPILNTYDILYNTYICTYKHLDLMIQLLKAYLGSLQKLGVT